MSALPQPEPADDLMAIADAVGVTAPAEVDPRIRPFLTDDALAGVLASWSRAAAGLPSEVARDIFEDPAWQHLATCPACDSTGLVDDYTGSAINCPTCGGDS